MNSLQKKQRLLFHYMDIQQVVMCLVEVSISQNVIRITCLRLSGEIEIQFPEMVAKAIHLENT